VARVERKGLDTFGGANVQRLELGIRAQVEVLDSINVLQVKGTQVA
jgi:hypothetical protein